MKKLLSIVVCIMLLAAPCVAVVVAIDGASVYCQDSECDVTPPRYEKPPEDDGYT